MKFEICKNVSPLHPFPGTTNDMYLKLCANLKTLINI